MASIRKRKNKAGFYYVVDYSDAKGKRHVISTKSSDFEIAKQIKAQKELECASEYYLFEELKNSSLSVFFRVYLNKLKPKKKSKTIQNESNCFDNFTKYTGDKHLEHINSDDINKYINLRLHKDKISSTTLGIELRTLKAAFNYAKNKIRLIQDNPFDPIPLPKIEFKRKLLTINQFESLIQSIDTVIKKSKDTNKQSRLRLLKQYFIFLRETGLRRAEALELPHIKISNNRLLVKGSKPGKFKTVLLTEFAKEVLYEAGDKYFSDLSQDYVSKSFAKFCRLAGLKGYTLYSVRWHN